MKDKHIFSDEYNQKKSVLISALNDESIHTNKKRAVSHLSKRMLCIAGAALFLTISACAAAQLVDFSLFEDGDNTHIHAGLVEPADPDAPLRAWVADKDEVSIMLVFDYMPADITRDEIAAGKWGGDDNSRAILFDGYDLRQSDLDNVISNVESVEAFMAGKNKAYIIRDASEAALYNKTLFVLFEEEDMVVRAYVTFGISEPEIKKILSGMRIEETDDTSLALPIENEDRSDVKIHGWINIDKPPIYYDELYKVGESAHYSYYAFGIQDEYHIYPARKYTITVEGYEIRDSFEGLSETAIERKDALEKFTDGKGNFIPYKRTELLHDENLVASFGETVEMTKRLVLVTVRLEDFYCNLGGAPRLDLLGYNLYDLVKNEDGTVKRYGREKGFVIDRTPGAHAEINEVVYNEDLGGGFYRLGYLLDVDQLDGELLLMSQTPNIHYVLK